MTRVCLVGEENLRLPYELLSRETARDALAAYDLREPYHSAVAVETVSLGAAVALLNDLNWYLARFVSEAMVLEPSVSETEWLSRDLATEIRDGACEPGETGRLLKLYGLEYPDPGAGSTGENSEDTGDAASGDTGDTVTGTAASPGGGAGDAVTGADASPGEDGDAPADAPRLVEPMFVARTGGGLPEYDLRDVEETLLLRVTEDEFES
ncbi:MAG: hypothetical protein J07HX64_01498 [halophilic archaeon J07HX64]|nr:MAG: hypothetical protein J07HX64_01498 [halophilic archaeon J07HX64]